MAAPETPLTPLFVTGMFRSGTTMIARMLAAHEHVACASDPFARLFKAIRNAVAAESGLRLDPDSPFADYYFDAGGIQLLQAVRSCCLSRLPVRQQGEELAANMARAAEPYSPDLAPRLATLRGETCLDMLQAGMALIREVYGDQDTRVIGFKDVWATEFVPTFLESHPAGRVICIIRDPRAVFLSKWKQQERYPLLFMARQWRKLAALAWLWSQSPELNERVLVLRYEDLVLHPDDEIATIANFLDLDDVGDMLNPAAWGDGGGSSWSQNTSFGSGKQAFDSSAVNRWEAQLPERERQLLEWICCPEMALFGYKVIGAAWSNCWGPILDPPKVSEDRLADWIRPYVEQDSPALAREYSAEFMRWHAINSDEEPSLDVQSRFCLDPMIYQACHEAIAGTRASCSS